MVNRDLVSFVQGRSPQTVATLDMDATVVETNKEEALYSYRGFKAYQPLNVYWAEQDLLKHCARGKDERFGVIEFAIGVDVTEEFKRAVAGVEDGEWHPYLTPSIYR